MYKSPHISAGLYVVATPIGTASDISLRALDLIANVNVLVAEDTRSLLKLMKIHEIELAGRPLISYNDHNGRLRRPKILSLLKANNSVIFVSDAGTPLIADPGYMLVSDAISNGIYVSGVPGASAVLASLMIAGLPTDKFLFGGFVPRKTEARKIFFSNYLNLPVTLVFYETSGRLRKCLSELCTICDNNRKVVVCRELTKKFENVTRGKLKEVADYFLNSQNVKGEIVILFWEQRFRLLPIV